jgi:hypothetical protein
MRLIPFRGKKRDTIKAATPEEAKSRAEQVKQAGQIIAIFALALTALIGLVGIAVDITFAWREELRIQRAADAAALAGVVYLPGNVTGGISASTQEAVKNGYTGGVGNTTVAAAQNPTNLREMDVAITARVPTFFMRAFGVDHFTVTRSSKAIYVLPVPMGSPDPYYGAFGTYHGKTTDVALTGPHSQAMSPRGFWASMVSQGAGTSSGDAYLPKKLNANETGTNPQHDTVNYHDYAIYMPPGSSSGHVWIFDPLFCDSGTAANTKGTGESWLGNGSGKGISSIYKLYNTNNQPYNISGHTLLGTSGSKWANMNYYDPDFNGENKSPATSCAAGVTSDQNDPRWYHMKWWDLSGYIGGSGTMSGGTGGTTYRLRTTTDPGDSSQDSADGYNNFAIYVEASGGTPQVYGIGAMQMYTPLPGGTSSEFYLAKIDAQSGAGKTVEIRLWDAGDTNTAANLQILQPTASGWSPVSSMTWLATKVSGDAANCSGGSGGSITTNSGSSNLFNGCWMTINIVVPTSYSAPQDGWWKIRYNITGSGVASDETTWQVNIRGNPVHLIPG